ncbi:MAG: hypothetical protein Q8R83_03915 [Legionellaceae bacterium]|nr:hypothetical protein [Legionellaceae bacterium]
MTKIKFVTLPLFIYGLSLFYPLLLNAQTIPAMIMLQDNWRVISSESIKDTNLQDISQPKYDASSWYDATSPTTVLNVLVQNGLYSHILDGLALQAISQESFDLPWLYRTSFNLDTFPPNAQLTLYGINYSADIWLNGKQVASKESIYNPFRQYQLDITPYLKLGANVLAMKIYPPKPEDFRIGFTDWNPNPPDRNMGITRNVQLTFNNGLEIKKPFIHAELNSPDNDEAKLNIQLVAVNHQSYPVKARVAIQIDGLLEITKTVNLAANEQKIMIFDPKNENKLNIKSPKLWWPNQMGEPYLYQFTAKISQNNRLSDLKTLHFGIRKIETVVLPYQENNKQTQSYYRGFKINGQPILIRGAAWTDSMLLNDSPQRVKDQLYYAKGMNLNAIRLEGFWGKDKTIYDTCDELGLLIMIGWSAQWEWPLRGFRIPEQCDPHYGCYTTTKDKELIAAAFKDQITWLRNNPSVFVWMFGSDLKPMSDLEDKLASLLKTLNPSVPYVISAAETLSARDNQPSGIKMRGPYIYVPPVYWFENTSEGGAFGFNSETGPGAEVPPLESLMRLLGNPQDYWPKDNLTWIYHEGGHPLLQTLNRYDKAMTARYGAPTNLEEYAQKSQLMNYESVRPMFEAFIAYQSGNPNVNGVPATGVFHWMLNAAWPKFFWQLYDYYLVPGSAYFSAKEANKSLHVLYNYANKNIYLSNHTLHDMNDMDVTARVWDTHSNRLTEQHWRTSIAATQAQIVGPLEIPTDITTSVFFVELILKDNNNQWKDHNVYWLSTTPDQLNGNTTILQNANYQELNNLPKAHLIVNATFSGHDSEKQLKVRIENKTDRISFFNRLVVKTGNENLVAPIYWSDNFITLFPHQSETITAHFNQEILQGEAPLFAIEGMNSTFKVLVAP